VGNKYVETALDRAVDSLFSLEVCRRCVRNKIPITAPKLSKNHKSYRSNNGFHNNIAPAAKRTRRHVSTIFQLKVVPRLSTHIMTALITLLSAPHNRP